jgi:adenosyl cobinamide kinase/adenosyl cobinamide phosphate guanylyltransferase
MALTLLIGGARSGKSGAAVTMASKWGGPVTVIATAEARDEDMAARIARHRASRPHAWTTIETDDLAGALSAAAGDAFVIVDCLTLWVSRVMDRELPDGEIESLAREAAALASSRGAPTVAVTNEVGSGIVPDNALARRFRDVLGLVNRRWAQAAGTTLLVVAGRALPLRPIEDLTRG